MPRVQWSELVPPTSSSSLHLLVASIPDARAGDGLANARSLQMMVRRLLKKLPLTGRYALTISRAHSRREIMCAFENRMDADLAARASAAASVEPRMGWATQHTFLLDEKAEVRLLKIAGYGEPLRPRRSQTEQ